MDNTSPYDVQWLRGMLEQLRAEKAELEAEYQGKVADLNLDIEACERLIARATGAPRPTSTASQAPLLTEPVPLTDARSARQTQSPLAGRSSDWARRLRSLTQPEALIRIAEDNGGIVRVADAKKIFMEAGLAKGKVKNINPHIYHILSRSDRFERIAPGVFRLQPEAHIHEPSAIALTQPDNDMIESVDFA